METTKIIAQKDATPTFDIRNFASYLYSNCNDLLVIISCLRSGFPADN